MRLPVLCLAWFGLGLALADENNGQPKPDGSRVGILDSPISFLQGDSILPDAIYLRNENGDPIFVPKVRYADFERYLKERTGVNKLDFPTAILESIDVRGVILDGYAELKIDLSMSMNSPSKELIRLPLSMRNMNWVSRPKTVGGKSNIVVAGSEDEGLTWWIEPDGSPKYTLSLEAVAKTEQSFSESSLRLELPESASKIHLEVPGSDLSIQWMGATGEVLQTQVANGTTQAVIRGRGGIGTLVWRDQISSRDLGAVEVDSSTRLLRNDDGKEYRGETRLRIVSDNRVGPRELIIVLPENAKWSPSPISGAPSNWTLNAWQPLEKKRRQKNAPVSAESTDTRERLLLRLSDLGRNIVEEISIDWTMTMDDPSNGNFSVTGIEVEGVQRHEGHLSVVLPMKARFSWLPSTEYLLSRQLPANDVSDAIEYDFRFNRQPIRLHALISDDAAQVRWRPDYLVSFDKNGMRLQGVLTFPNDPSQLIGLNIVGGNWKLDTVVWDKTGELVETEFVDGNTVRFLPSNLSSTDDPLIEEILNSNSAIAIRFSAFQNLPANDDIRTAFQLPQISLVSDGKRKVERGTGTLVLDYGSWQVIAAETRIVGFAKSSELPSSLNALLTDIPASELQIFRFQSSGPNCRWNGRITRTQQATSASMTTRVAIQNDEWRIERNWSMRSVGPNLQRLPIRIPSSWVEDDQTSGLQRISDEVKVTSDGLAIEFKVIDKPKDGWVTVESTRSTWPAAFDLQLTFRQAIPFPDSEHADIAISHSIRLPLPQLGVKPTTLISDHQATIEAGPNLQCIVDQAGSKPMRYTHQDRRVTFPLSDTNQYLDVQIAPLISMYETTVDVQRVWLQTIKNSQQRRERCVMRLETRLPSITFQLPPGWSETATNILVNHRKMTFEPDINTGFYRVILPIGNDFKTFIAPPMNEDRPSQAIDGEPKLFVVEFWNHSEISESWNELIEARLPRIVGSSGSTSLLWHIVLPTNEHLWTSSSTLLSDQRWVWENLGWRRRSRYSQELVEKEFGASVQPLIASQTNQYVFTSVGSTGTNSDYFIGQIRVVPRYVLWLPVAMAVLILTALWPKLGVLRHPWLLLVVVVILGLLSMIAADMTIMLIQAALASLLIVTLVKLLSWASKQRVHRRSIFTNRTLPVSPNRQIPRGSPEESATRLPPVELTGSASAALTPSTHAMEDIQAIQNPEIR